MSSSDKNKPRDENSNGAFEEDKWIHHLLNNNNNSSEKEGEICFGIVLVANWPNKNLSTPYRDKFLPKIKTYFEPEDFDCDNNNNDNSVRIPAVYLYPPSTLHVTICTFHPFTAPYNDIISSDQEESCFPSKEEFSAMCTEIMNASFARSDWPKKTFNLELNKVHVGVKAGILLWNENDAVNKMRQIIKEEYDSYTKKKETTKDNSILPPLIIPGIIHTTFMRFGRKPKSDRMNIVKRFETDGDEIRRYFNKSDNYFKNDSSSNKHDNDNDNIGDESNGRIEVDSVRLVCERSPYMHVPMDERHVLTSFEV